MAIFRRRKDDARPEPVSLPDVHLDPLSGEQADYLRRLFAWAWPASAGPITIHGDHAESPTLGKFGFANLAVRVRAEDSLATWPEVVIKHVQVLVAAHQLPGSEAMADLDLLRQVRIRLVLADFVPPNVLDSTFRYRRRVTDDLCAILMLDYPDHVTTMSDVTVARFDAEELWRTATRRVESEPFGDLHHVEVSGSGFTVLAGESIFTSSRFLTVPDVLQRIGVADAPYGVLLGAPYRNQLAFHVIRGLDVLSVVGPMRNFVQLGHSDGVSPISPDLYFWIDGEYERITSPDTEPGSIKVDATGWLGQVINELGPAGGSGG